MKIVNEKSSAILTLTFEDESENAVTPDSGIYRIDDIDSGTEIKGDTAFTPSSSTHDITLTATENAIIDSTQPYETKLVTVTFVYGTKQGTGEYQYKVRNLRKIS